MSVQKQSLYMSIDEYLAFEERSSDRHEFLDGQLFAMAGTSLRHNIIADNMHSILKAHVKGSRCRSFIFEVKVKIKSINSFYYPDVVLSCTPMDTSAMFIEDPVLLVEVLSPSTAAIDRREKLMAYKQIVSLQQYIIIHQSLKRLDVSRKDAAGHFSAAEEVTRGSFTLDLFPCGPLTINVESVYEGVDWGVASNDGTVGVAEAAGELSW